MVWIRLVSNAMVSIGYRSTAGRKGVRPVFTTIRLTPSITGGQVNFGEGQNRTLRLLSMHWPPVCAGEQNVSPPKG